MTKCLWHRQAAHGHYWTKPFPTKAKLVLLNSSHCQGCLERQSGFLQIFFACHSCFIALWKEKRPTRSRSEAYILRKLNERQKPPSNLSIDKKKPLLLTGSIMNLFGILTKWVSESKILTYYSPLACMLFTITKKLWKKLEGRALCKYARIDEHTLSLHSVIPCWEQSRKPYCKSRLAGMAFRFNLNHSEVIQKGFFHFVQHAATLFLRISRKGWAETGPGSQVMMMHQQSLSESLLRITEKEKSPVWLGSHVRSSLSSSIFRGRLAIKCTGPSLGLYGQFNSDGFQLFVLLRCSHCNDTGLSSLSCRNNSYHLQRWYQVIQDSVRGEDCLRNCRGRASKTWWLANTMTDKIQCRLQNDARGEENNPNLT